MLSAFQPKRDSPKGGQYMCVHMRRKDYVYSREGQIPSVKGAAAQVKKKMEEQGIKAVFVSTDAPMEEFKEFESQLEGFSVEKYIPDHDALHTYRDGGVAIIDQSICSHAKYFLGSPESTFSFRIQGRDSPFFKNYS
jgi:peptide-O-fucosyltransferase